MCWFTVVVARRKKPTRIRNASIDKAVCHIGRMFSRRQLVIEDPIKVGITVVVQRSGDNERGNGEENDNLRIHGRNVADEQPKETQRMYGCTSGKLFAFIQNVLGVEDQAQMSIIVLSGIHSSA